MRSLDDDASSRMRAADERIYEGMSEQVLKAQEKLARRKLLDRTWRTGAALGSLSLLVGVIGTVIAGPARFERGALICASTLAISLLVMAGVAIVGKDLAGRQRAEMNLSLAQETLWREKTKQRPELLRRRELYREEVAGITEQYQTDSRRYRRVHNSLQSLIMIGSAATTTIAALDTGKQLTWQSISLTGISFSITLAAMFTGYYKFRERSYFLQQTADAIEEEANAVGLGVGPYSDFGTDALQQATALKLFTQRVEGHRNEQRRRQQQLDQPSDQAVPPVQPPG